ncbi:MAG: DNA repair protein RecO [Lachnoclostridium sp.]|jgi:DNA repair protein RecO (recombination protein O)|nr:DNA repair protein RecO [Lachnoclostridium sp.]
MQENITGMVLGSSPIGDYDKRIILLTKEYGKISAFAKGARKQNSPLLACLQPFTFGKFLVYRGKDSNRIIKVFVENYFTELRSDLNGIYYAYYFCEMADYFSVENVDGYEMLILLYQSFRGIMSPSIDNRLIRCIMELKMLTLNGESPRVFACAKCGADKGLHYFVIKEQGVLCDLCGSAVAGLYISDTALFTMQKIIRSDCKSLFSFSVSERVLDELHILIGSYWNNRVDREFRSKEILEDTLREIL